MVIGLEALYEQFKSFLTPYGFGADTTHGFSEHSPFVLRPLQGPYGMLGPYGMSGLMSSGRPMVQGPPTCSMPHTHTHDPATLPLHPRAPSSHITGAYSPYTPTMTMPAFMDGAFSSQDLSWADDMATSVFGAPTSPVISYMSAPSASHDSGAGLFSSPFIDDV